MASGKVTIGLAGGIGSGKSKVAELLSRLGCLVINSDAVNREQLAMADVRDALVSWWGSQILDERGQVDRRRVAEIVFADAAERRRLEQLLHPRIEAARRRVMDAAQSDPAVRAFVIDAPLLYEAGLDQACHAVIFVDAPQAVREARVMETRGWSAAELRRREASQMDLATKKSRADHQCVNDSDERELAVRVEQLLNEILGSER